MKLALDIAEAVVTELASAPGSTFSPAFTSRRMLLPRFTLDELAELHVTVVPRSVEITNATRQASQHDVTVDICIQKRLATKDIDTEIEPLAELVDEIAAYLARRPLASIPAVWVKTANDPIYGEEHLADDRVFTSLLTIIYRTMR